MKEQTLVIPTQTIYSGRGGISMSSTEPGNKEVPTRPEEVKAEQKKAEKPEVSKNRGVKDTSELEHAGASQLPQDRAAREEAVRKLIEDPKVQQLLSEAGKATPEQGALRERKEEAQGVELTAQLHPAQFIRPGEQIANERLHAVLQRAQETVNQNPALGGNSTWIEGVYNELGVVRSSFVEKMEEVDKKLHEVWVLRDKEGWTEEQFGERSEEVQTRRREIQEGIDAAEQYLERVIAMVPPDTDLAGHPLRRDDLAKKIIDNLNNIKANQGEYEWRRALKEFVGGINVEEGQDPELLKYIAQDREASERFWDLLVSKPFIHPDVMYREGLDFHGRINKKTFLDSLKTIDTVRHRQYVQLEESSERLHEFNRVVFAESGNPEAYTNFSRSITHQYLLTATQLDGVEVVRQLYEMAYGRLFAKENRVTADNYQPEIEDWVKRQFKELVRTGKVRSTKYKDENGSFRNLEIWEEERAFAMGRNLSTSFYRQSELMSWSAIPNPWERWIESLPTETVVRAMGGPKFLPYRFRIGQGGGGEWFTALLYDKIGKTYKGPLRKIGKLDIKKDLYPGGFFKSGGFDKGWRVWQAYWRNDAMRIDLSILPPEQQAKYAGFIQEFGLRPTLGDFIYEQEYMAQEKAVEEAKVAGVEIPTELLLYDSGKQKEDLAKDFIPLLGFRRVSGGGENVVTVKTPKGNEYYQYDSDMDQIHLNFGASISFGAANETVKTLLWAKTAEALPLRMAYFLAEDGVGRWKGVKAIPGYNNVRGEGENLFRDDFEFKLISLQRDRIAQQNAEQLTAYHEGRKANMIGLDLDDPSIGLTQQEKEFVGNLIQLGKDNAQALAKVAFPHVPFHDDTTYQNSDYTKLRGETFPRRQGGDFVAFITMNSEYNTIISHLGELGFDGFVEHAAKIRDNMSTPENYMTGQDTVAPLLEIWLELAKQYGYTKVPFVKTALNLLNKPTSEMQRLFGTGAPSDDESEINGKVKQAALKQLVRRLKRPGEDKSQVDDLLGKLKAKWFHVLGREVRNALLIYSIFMAMEFGKKVKEDKS